MDWDDQDGTEEEIFLLKLSQSVNRMDHVLDQPSIPSKEQLKDHINERWNKRRKSMKLELILFWLVSLFLIGSGMLLVYSAPWILLGIQGFSFITAICLMLRFVFRRRKEGMG
jgi:maltodextrin utilization protein YvdJ